MIHSGLVVLGNCQESEDNTITALSYGTSVVGVLLPTSG